MLRTAARAATRAAGVAAVGSSGYAAYLYQTDEGTERMIRAYSALVPVVLHYRFMEARHKISPRSDEDWKAMDMMYAEPTVQKLGELQGMYTKYGQTAAGLTNTFSDIWIQQLRKLESEVPPRPAEVVFKTVQEETGKPVSETFEYFDPNPLGSASIGQVHRARLIGGREVAVKVQYPDSARLFRKDMKTIRTFCEMLAPENVVTLSALEKQNASELDYQIEAENLRQVTVNMKRHGFMPREAVVPQPISELTTQRMLVMELLPGTKLVDGIRAYFSVYAEQNGTTLEALEKEARQKIEEEGIPAKYSGPTAFQLDLLKKGMFCQDAIVNAGKALFNSTVGLFGAKLEYTKSTVPPNIPRIIDALMRIHGYQILKDGLFQADPHAGNFIMLPDGRIGLIDYGATKQLTRNERLSVLLLYVALWRNDDDMLFELCELSGYKSKYGKKQVLMKLLRFGFDSWGKDVMGGKNVQQFIDDLKAEDPWEEVPDNLVMAQFMSVRLRSLALGMNHPVRCSEWWGPLAEKILKEEGLPYESWDREQLIKYKPVMNMQKFKFA